MDRQWIGSWEMTGNWRAIQGLRRWRLPEVFRSGTACPSAHATPSHCNGGQRSRQNRAGQATQMDDPAQFGLLLRDGKARRISFAGWWRVTAMGISEDGTR